MDPQESFNRLFATAVETQKTKMDLEMKCRELEMKAETSLIRGMTIGMYIGVAIVFLAKNLTDWLGLP